MFRSLLTISLVSIGLTSLAQKEFVCSPCGYDCDKDVYHAAGTCSSCNMKLVDKSTVRFKNLSADEFAKRINENPHAVILDVRSPEEFKGTGTEMPSFGHFKNAININVQELESRLNELSKYKDKEILVYCSHSHRSPRASYLLSTNGFKNVSNMTGGVSTIVSPSNELLKKYFVAHK
jgi:rhodanese-related sulfurtransferase